MPLCLLFLLALTSLEAYAGIEVAKLSDKTVCLGSENGELTQFDLDSFEIINRIKAHDRAIVDISFSPDNQKIATVAADGVKIWERAILKPIITLPFSANNASFNPENSGQLLISGSNLIALVDESGKIILNIPHIGTAKASFSNRGDLILITDFDQGLVTIYDLKTKNIIYSMSERQPSHAVFAKDDQKVIISAGDTIVVYDINLHKVKTYRHTLPFAYGYDNWILHSLSSSHDQYVISIDKAGCLIRLDLSVGIDKLVVLGESLKYSEFFGDDKKILVVTHKSIIIFDTKSLILLCKKVLIN